MRKPTPNRDSHRWDEVGACIVSTVKLPDGDGSRYETLIYIAGRGWDADGTGVQTCTEAEADAAHLRACARAEQYSVARTPDPLDPLDGFRCLPLLKLPDGPKEIALTGDTKLDGADLNRFLEIGGVVRNPGYRVFVDGDVTLEALNSIATAPTKGRS